jgi:hypothetical protein
MNPTETKSTVLLKHHLKALKLSTMLAECEKIAQRCAADNADHLAFLLQLCELELIERERRAAELIQLATEKTRLADAERAEREKALARLYFSQIAHADAAMNAGDTTLAKSILSSIPFSQRKLEHRLLTRRVEGTPLTLRFPVAGANCVAFSPDGRRLASGGDKTIVIWDALTGSVQRTWNGHDTIRPAVKHLAFSPDGERLATSSAGDARVWDALTGKRSSWLGTSIPLAMAVPVHFAMPTTARGSRSGLAMRFGLWMRSAAKRSARSVPRGIRSSAMFNRLRSAPAALA